jgi:hypothetical protein
MWNKDTNDWQNPSTVLSTFSKWLTQPHIGAISLQHDLYNTTAAQVPGALDLLLKSGYTVTDISKCIALSRLYDDGLLAKTGLIPGTAASPPANANTPTTTGSVNSTNSSSSNSNPSPVILKGSAETFKDVSKIISTLGLMWLFLCL